MNTVLELAAGAAHTLAGASVEMLLVAVALHLFKVTAEARSWHGIVSHAHPAVPLRFATTLGAFAGAIGANAVLPARVGEALRVGIVRRRLPGSSVGTIAGTIVLETGIEIIFGLVVLAFLIAAGQSTGPFGAPLAFATRLGPIAVASVGCAIVVAGVVAFVMRRRLGRLVASLARGMSVVSDPRRLLHGVLLWKLLAWTFRFAAVYFFLLAFHLGGTIWLVLLVIGAQNIAGLLPLAPGSAGAQQAVLALALAGTVRAGTIVGFGVGMQAATALSDVLIGIVAVALVSSWSDLRDAIRPSRKRLSTATP